MPDFSRLLPRFWWIVLLVAGAFVIFADVRRAQRVLHVTNTDRDDAIVDPASPTGYAGGRRWLIVPEHHARSYQWLAETQQMFARGEWRVRHIDSENAPFGREVHAASPYRWWIGALAWCDHKISGRPLGIAVERAALWADPALHLLLMTITALVVARWFGRWSAVAFAAGCATLYPFAGSFLPGVPHDRGLIAACALWSVLPLLAALRSPRNDSASPTAEPDARRAQPLLMSAGIAGGIGFWLSAAHQTIVLGGIGVGALLAIAMQAVRRAGSVKRNDTPLPWLTWAVAGASTSLAAYLCEYFPSRLGLRLEVNHPLYAVAWLGMGLILALFDQWSRRRDGFWTPMRIAAFVFASLAVAALPVTIARTRAAVFAGELSDSRVVNLPHGTVAPNLAGWLARDGFSLPTAAVCLSIAIIGLGLWHALREPERATRLAFAIAVGAAVGTTAMACARLAWWPLTGALLLALVVLALGAERPTRRRVGWSAVFGITLLAGLVPLLPHRATANDLEFTPVEVEALLERELAHWLAERAPAGGAVVLGPPARTVRWCFHGGLRGIGSANWENREGLAATVRLATATSAEEAQALLNARGVTHLVLPSWDTDLNEFARWSLANPNDAFITALQHWAVPTWLRPVAYRLPTVAGFEAHSVAVFAVTDDSNRAASVSRLAEYFIEMGDVERAAMSRENLRRYPTDLSALVALARIEKARGDDAAFGHALESIQAGVTSGLDRLLPWDRRASLAVVLALGGRNVLAREQVRRCVAQLNAERIRMLTTGSLYQLLVLAKAYDLSIADPAQRELALRLLPAELRGRL